MKVLVVDDDPQIAGLIAARLKQDNFQVEIASSGEQAIAFLEASPYSLVLLDVMLPQLSGIEVCEQLRYQGDQTPILMLTGKEHTQDKVLALDAGADDYLVKPFELDELAARVRALLRRNAQVSTPTICYGALAFDPSRQVVTYDDHALDLRPKELAILELLLRYPTQVFNADAFLDRLWPLAECPGRDTVKTHIRSLRKQLEAIGASDVIETLYGRGYRLNSIWLEQQAAIETSQVIAAKAWQQMQDITWNRLVRLKAIGQSLQGFQGDRTRWKNDCKEAIALAHQLKGNLGSFGFHSASVQAKRLETLLVTLLTKGKPKENAVVESFVADVDKLKSLLQPHMTNYLEFSTPSAKPSVSTAQSVLVIAHDTAWAAQLQQAAQGRSFELAVRSPITVNHYLLEKTPALILLELSAAEQETDLSLLEALASNYGEQVPILAVIYSDQAKEQLLAIQKGAIQKGAIALAFKDWSINTLIAVMAEYLGASYHDYSDTHYSAVSAIT